MRKPEFQRGSKIYRIVDYKIEEFDVLEYNPRIATNSSGDSYTVRNTITGSVMNVSRLRAEEGDTFTSFSPSKIYLLTIIEEKLEIMHQEALSNLIKHKDDFYERSKKFDNLKFITK